MDRKQIGEALRARRLALGLTLREVASRCDVSFSAIGQIENGTFNATLDTLLSIASGLETELHVLLGDSADDAALGSVPEHRREVARRFLRVLGEVPGDDVAAFLATLSLWEIRYQRPA